jgi:hypothetical protein
MPGTEPFRRVLPVLLSVVLVALPVRAAAPQPAPTPPPGRSAEEGDVEVRCTDDSVLKLKLLDEKLELVTKHGVLRIAAADVRRIEFATRTPAAAAEKVALALSRLNHSDFKVREQATEELKGYRARAYPQVLKALKSEDPEVNRRADEIATFIRAKVPAALLEVREFDVVYTDDSKIAGHLTAEYLRVETLQFGEQRLKLHDAHVLRTGAARDAELQIAAQGAPQHLANYQNQFGKEYAFTVTGALPGQHGNVWGTGPYTLDSHFPTAAVHAGLARPGETVTVKVRIIVAPAQFAGSTRHGVTTTEYGAFPAGAYEFIRK